MLLGDVPAWIDRFITVDDRFLERIAAVWPNTIAALPAQPQEDTITISLVDHLSKDPIVRRICHWVEYQFEPFGIAPDGSKFSKGRIDIAVLFDWERDRYLAYECKRLNLIHGGKRSSLATRYVTDGMMRFLTEQYAEQLPMGCMLGYVLDGDITFAFRRVGFAIHAHAPLGLIGGPTTFAAVQTLLRFGTLHSRPTGTEIELRHALVS